MLTLCFCVLFLLAIPKQALGIGIDLEELSVKGSIGLDLLTLGFHYNVTPRYFVQLDVNPVFMAGAGTVGRRLFENKRHKLYTGIGVGVSLAGFGYIYPGAGYLLKISKSHAIYIEGAVGFVSYLFNSKNDNTDNYIGNLNIVRLGYQVNLF